MQLEFLVPSCAEMKQYVAKNISKGILMIKRSLNKFEAKNDTIINHIHHIASCLISRGKAWRVDMTNASTL
ncbi:CLUMA_CG012542, isoform A [Clunio marinus]|uniref:CLUMA_CG012542, isoform A n=1 Tax=Clunio marinus TaxID=568069 RepID=A0A1J1IFZ9_9DIPT|nr:CLUMA_CG012542, isoform A [Clunio marinus]